MDPSNLLLHPTDERPPCASRSRELNTLTQAELDAYLASGWYRIGARMTYCEYLSSREHPRGVVWTRVPLEGYSFRKSLRRTRRKVERDFDVQVHPAAHDEEHEALYARYLDVAPGERSEDLWEFKGGALGEALFETWEVSVRDGDELIAFSWFDRGERSLQSLVGAYAPEYARYSLGFYTMLRELQFGIDEGLSYFYAGYVLCGDDSMDYKLRTGHIECLERPSGRWRPLEEFDLEEFNPVRRTEQALSRARDDVEALAGWEIHENPHFALGAWAPNLASCLAYPHVLWPPGPPHGAEALALAWDSTAQFYELLQCMRGALSSPDGEVLVDDLIVVTRSLGRWDTLEEVAAAIRG